MRIPATVIVTALVACDPKPHVRTVHERPVAADPGVPDASAVADAPTPVRASARPPDPSAPLTKPTDVLVQILGHESELRRCYTESLKRDDPSSDARVVLWFYVDDLGHLDQIRIGGSSYSPELARCLTTAMRGWQLNATSGGPYEINLTVTE